MINKSKVLVIGLDGASYDIIRTAMIQGKMPFLKNLFEKKGNIVKLRSTIPSSTAPSWTSMMTGVNPGKHGIYDFLIHNGFKERPAKYSDVKKPFVWDILSKYGIKSAIIGHPLTYPVKKDKNILMVSGILSPELNELSVYPSELIHILKEEKYSIDIEEKMPLLKSNPKKALKLCNDSALSRAKASKRILTENEWDFGFILFPESDRLLHYHITKRDIVLEHFKILDNIIENLASLEDGNLKILITSDHGFTKIRKVLAINALLHNMKLCKLPRKNLLDPVIKHGIRWNKGVLAKALGHLGITRRIIDSRGNSYVIKESSEVWFTPYAESGLRLNPLISKRKKEKLIELLLKILNNIKDPSTDEPMLKALRSKDVYWGDEVNNAPDIVLIPMKNYIATHVPPPDSKKILFNPEDLFLKEGDHVCEYGQYGVLGVHGFKINRKRDYSVMDITPTILKLFDAPVEDYMDGKPLIK